MNKERFRKKHHDTTPCPYQCKLSHPPKGSSKKDGQSTSREETDILKKEGWKDIIPEDVGASMNAFQSTDEEVRSDWEDILPDSFSSTHEENDSASETIDLTSLSDTELAEHSSAETMRFKASDFPEETISPIEYTRKTLDFVKSDIAFSPELPSVQGFSTQEFGFELGSPVRESTKLQNSLEKENSMLSTFGVPEAFNFEEDKDSDSLDNENPMLSTIGFPEIFNFEEDKDSEISFLTTVNTEDIVDTVFDPPGEQHTLEMNEKTSLDDEKPTETPQRGRKGPEKIKPKQLFINNQFSSKNKGKRKGRSIANIHSNSSKSATGSSKGDPYQFSGNEADFEEEVPVQRSRRSILTRKKTPSAKSTRGRKKYTSSRSEVTVRPLTE